MNSSSPATAQQTPGARISRPLCVVLDGTLIATDLFSESGLACMRQKPWVVIFLPAWHLRGRAYMKRKLAEQATIDPAALPYYEDVVQFLRDERADGREILLVTAADETYARDVAHYLGVFSAVLASDGKTNVKGKQKLATIRARLGDQEFDYIGDSSADLPVLGAATRAFLVRPSSHFLSRTRQTCRIERTFGKRPSYARGIWRALRVHQWTSNLLVWVPLLLSHQITDTQRLLWGLLAFIMSFNFVASGVYVVSGLFDVQHDRQHSRNRKRPFASAALPLWVGAIMAPVLFVCGFALAANLRSPNFVVTLALYMVLGVGYSVLARRMLVLDVLVLATLYTLPLLSGGLAVRVAVSPWLLVFCMFLFLSLLSAKRYTESKRPTDRAARNGWFS